ncbi:hypothetical protein ACOSP7_000300 [Xanthoceras sorbifolium]
MSCHRNQEQEMPFINPPSPSHEGEEEELLLLHQTTTLDTSSSDDPSATNRFSLLNLHGFPPSSSSPTSAAAHSHLACTKCGYCGVSPGSHKRPSPEPSSAAALDREQPKTKKPNNHSPSLHGFSKIPLPTQDQPLLRRCCSDPNSPPIAVANTAPQVLADPPQSPPQNAEISRPETPLSAVRASAAKLPPRAPPLRRSVSDPSPSPSKTFSSSCGTMGAYESPNDKRLRRMRDCIREMNTWWDEILPEEEGGGTAMITNNSGNNNGATMENSEVDIEESVSVERSGGCLIIHFKCPCGKGYQILLSGRNCYYKLM